MLALYLLPLLLEGAIFQSCPQTRCLSGQCINWNQIGDSFCDCTDGSDEPSGFCTPGSSCRQLTCRGSNICYTPAQIDNSVCECPQGEDEPSGFVRCPVTPTSAPTSVPTTTAAPTCPQASCRNGQCINFAQVGDSFCDCTDGSDERSGFCTPGSSCRQLTCRGSNICYTPAQIDNSVCDCPQGDDEPSGFVRCSVAPSPSPTTSAPTKASCGLSFTCGSGQCIPFSRYGDGFCDCLDGSDERPGFCTPGSNCRQLTCKTGGACYSPSQINDFVCNCPDGEDEPNSGKRCP